MKAPLCALLIQLSSVPKDEETVGRLSICLPSKHLGGDLHASYCEKTKKVTTGPFSAFS